jgi:uncharacterized protein
LNATGTTKPKAQYAVKIIDNYHKGWYKTTMKRVQRFDIARLDKVELTPEGFVESPVRATRVGVFLYKDATGKPFRELRLPDEVFNPDSMATLAMKPITNEHPSELVTVDNIKDVQVGYTGENVKADGQFLHIDRAVFTDKKTIDDINKGKREVSCGYELELDFSGGFWNGQNVNQDGDGEQFDAIQRNIRYNHLALVSRGRAGAAVRLRLDSEMNQIQEDQEMPKIKIGDKMFECSQDLADAFEDMTKGHAKKCDELTQAAEAAAVAKTDAEAKLTAEVDKQKGRADALETQLTAANDPVKFQERVSERMHLLSTAVAIMGNADAEAVKKLDAMSDVDVMKTAIGHVNKGTNFDGKSNDFVAGQFEILANGVNADKGDKLGKDLVGDRKDRAGDDGLQAGDKAREERIKKDAEAWKQPLAGSVLPEKK